MRSRLGKHRGKRLVGQVLHPQQLADRRKRDASGALGDAAGCLGHRQRYCDMAGRKDCAIKLVADPATAPGGINHDIDVPARLDGILADPQPGGLERDLAHDGPLLKRNPARRAAGAREREGSIGHLPLPPGALLEGGIRAIVAIDEGLDRWPVLRGRLSIRNGGHETGDLSCKPHPP